VILAVTESKCDGIGKALARGSRIAPPAAASRNDGRSYEATMGYVVEIAVRMEKTPPARDQLCARVPAERR
jgi:hypothetical protein